MSIQPKLVGDLSPKVQPGSPTVMQGIEYDDATIEIQGNTAQVISGDFAANTFITVGTYSKNMYLESQTLKVLQPNGMAHITLKYSDKALLPAPIYECEYVQLDRDLFQHPIFNTGGAYTLTATDLAQIAEWQNYPAKVSASDATTSIYSKAYPNLGWVDVNNPTTYTPLSGNAQLFAQKWQKGERSYKTCYPVFKATKFYISQPTLSPCDVLGAPTGGGFPSGYQWLLTASRRRFNNKYWTLEQEWTGAKYWDTDLYT